jgi:hypothetical protein
MVNGARVGKTLVLLGVALQVGAVAHGATYIVTNLNDIGFGTLRQAVANANGSGGADTITFLPGLAGTIPLIAGELVLTGDVTISGPGSAVLAVSGNNISRVFQIASGATATISGLTITSGQAPAGGGFYNGGTLLSLGHNLSGDGSGNLTAAGDLPNTDPLLGPLADNGGPTWTHALLPGSPAIDAGGGSAAPATDQRGLPRPRDGNGDGGAVVDIGAFEVQAFTPVSVVSAVSRKTHGAAGDFDVEVSQSAAVEARHGSW